ncbi:MAG TPA: hypothetical protein VIN61_04490 [Gammaproteobacteria bacterium]
MITPAGGFTMFKGGAGKVGGGGRTGVWTTSLRASVSLAVTPPDSE